MNIRDQLCALGIRWFSQEYVFSFRGNVPRLMEYLTIHAWKIGVHTGPESELLRAAWHRLDADGAIVGDYP